MSMYGLSDSQLAQLFNQSKPQVAPYTYAGQSLQVPQAAAPVSGGVMPVTAAAPAAAAPGATGAAPAAGAAVGAMGGSAMGYANIASSAINQIAGAAQTYVDAKAKADILRNTQPVPDVPESQGALAGFNAPQLKGLGSGALNIG